MNILPYQTQPMSQVPMQVYYSPCNGSQMACVNTPIHPQQPPPQPYPQQQQQQQQQQYIMVPATYASQPIQPPQAPPQPQQQPMMMVWAQQPPQSPTVQMVPVQAAPQSYYMQPQPSQPQYQHPPQQPQSYYIMGSDGVVYAAAPQHQIQQQQQQHHQQQPMVQPKSTHTAYYVPQEYTYVNGGHNHTTVVSQSNATSKRVPKERSSEPINHESLCRHYMQGRCNRRKCRFLHLSGGEAEAFLASHPAGASATPAPSQEAEDNSKRGDEMDAVSSMAATPEKAAQECVANSADERSSNAKQMAGIPTVATTVNAEEDVFHSGNGGMSLRNMGSTSSNGNANSDGILNDDAAPKDAFAFSAFSDAVERFMGSGDVPV